MTIYEIARLAGVSIATISRVLNQSDKVKPQTRDKILAVIETTGYTPNQIARELTTKTGKTLGLVLPGVNSYFSPVVEAMARRLGAQGGHLLIAANPGGVACPREEADSLRLLLSKRVQGVVFFVPKLAEEHLKVMDKWPDGTSLVLVNEKDPFGRFSSVIQDPEHGMRALFGHLVEKGYRRLAFIDGPSRDKTAEDRRLLSGRLSSAFGLQTKPEWRRSGHFDLASGYDACLGLLERPGFDAVVCANDNMAFGALKALHERGISVPGQVAVTGYDNAEMAEYSHPPLTTLSQPGQDLGQAAMRLIEERWEDSCAPPDVVSLPASLIVRATT